MSGKTYSIQLRLQRVVHQDAYVGVPVTAEILRPHPDGTQRIDSDALVAAVLTIAEDPRLEWRVESTEVTPHPIQGPLPEDRTSFDAHHSGGAPD